MASLVENAVYDFGNEREAEHNLCWVRSYAQTFWMMTLLAITGIPPAIAAEPSIYMGKASTGEAVYYHGAKAQCGDLPKTDECWKNPMVSYTIGSDFVIAISDCRRGVFKEV